MARPEKNTVDYYPHLVGDGKKMFFIETKYGNDGYATWHKLLEKLCSTEFHYLNLNLEEETMFLSAKCKVSEEKLLQIINDITKLGEFDKELWGSKIIWCQDLIDSIQDAYKKRNNECITLEGLRQLLTGLGILKPDKSNPADTGNTQRKEEKTKGNKSKGESAFAPPTFEEVSLFFKEKASESKWTPAECETEARKFINFYDSKNWYVGKNKMAKWPAAAAGWINRAFNFQQTNKKDSSGHPDHWDEKYYARLDVNGFNSYAKHLRSLGWYAVLDRQGNLKHYEKKEEK